MISATLLLLPGAPMNRRLNVLILGLLLALPASAQIYQWRDAQGNVHYSDTPPPSEKVRTVKDRTPPPPVVHETAPADSAAPQGEAPADGSAPGTKDGAAAEPAKPKTTAEKDADFRKRRLAASEEQAKAEKERQRNEEIRRYCDQARGQITALQSGRRISRYSPSGEKELLDEKARADELERAQKYVSENCK